MSRCLAMIALPNPSAVSLVVKYAERGDRSMPVPPAQVPGAPVVGEQVIRAVAAAPGGWLAAGGVRRRLVLARAGAVDCPEPVTHDSKVPPIRWRWQINVRQRGPL